ncbi:IS200/IS605 family transposase [Escherichia coli]|nr:IS200/IS605 family transposase [Escherichia coli]EGO9453939.1 IS200/IS605 family transposase [Escherichia coli]EGO9578149.1 IS200/IS605 family transposase [Escherichia coli]EJP1023600.1 IS200/IS605 family transposase [Escherichia coli]HCB8753161.1 IS200/IS605 family transposase [Escherichia coli]
MILWSVKKETDIRRGRHCVFLMHVHLVFVTKYRRQIFDHDATEKLRTYFSNVCADFEAELVEMDGEPDHVHLLINYPPKLAISSLVNSLKGVSGRLLRRDRPDITVRYYYKGVLWSPGNFASSCGGAPMSVIRQYIEQQQTPGQVENRALYPRPEGRGFTAHRISLEIIYTGMDIIVLCTYMPHHILNIKVLEPCKPLCVSVCLIYLTQKKIELISSSAILRIK